MDVAEITRGFKKTTLTDLPLTDFAGDLDKRWKTLGPFLEHFLGKYDDPLVLDAAMGSGHDTITLLKKEYRVVSNEIDKESIKYALRKAKEVGVRLDLRKVDWVEFEESTDYSPGQFDFIFSLGNSFPNYFLDEESRLKALRGFWRTLKPGGIFLFDTRNYDYMLDDAGEILKDPESNFRYTYATTYLNKDIHGFPVEISPGKVRFVWKNYRQKKWAELTLWPVTVDSVRDMVKDTLGKVDAAIYYDYQPGKPPHHDFVQFALTKP